MEENKEKERQILWSMIVRQRQDEKFSEAQLSYSYSYLCFGRRVMNERGKRDEKRQDGGRDEGIYDV